MRIKLTLRTKDDPELFFNYNYPLSAAIYKTLQFGSPQFSEYLHDIGFKTAGKTYKLFTFALLFDKKPGIKNGLINLKNLKATLVISSPLTDNFIRNFVIGSFEKTSFELSANGIKTAFGVEQVESFPEPAINSPAGFRMLSPLVLSTGTMQNGKMHQVFLRYNSDKETINKVFNTNLANKYELLTGTEYYGKGVKLTWDWNYIEERLNHNKNLTRKISVEPPGKPAIDIIGNMIPFTLTGDTELMKVGYQCGFGEKNSMGFGMAEVI